MIRIVTVAFRNAEHILRWLQSLEKNVQVPFEVVIWDNTEKPLEALRALNKPRVHVLAESKNLGFAKAVNLATHYKTSGTWDTLLLLNPDAWLDTPITSQLEAQLALLPGLAGFRVFDDAEKKHRQLSARRFPSFVTSIAGREGLLTRVWPSNPWSRRYLGGNLATDTRASVDWLSGCAIFTKRSTWEKLGGFDERFFLYVEDVDLGRRAAQLDVPVEYVPWVDVIHETGGSSRTRPAISDFYHHQGMLRYSWKWGRPVQRLLIPITFVGIVLRYTFRRVLGKLST